ncbi:MAG: SRPBCC family protein [Frankiaceae bacterium]
MTRQLSVTREIQAPAQQVWELVADVSRMGEWSPENAGAKWLPGVKGPQRGARFLGENRNGWRRWWTLGTVIDSEPGRLLSFRVTAPVFKVADWSYEVATTPAGCLVTESWTDLRGSAFRVVSERVTGVRNRAELNRTNMEDTLDRLKAAAESSSDPTPAGSPG